MAFGSASAIRDWEEERQEVSKLKKMGLSHQEAKKVWAHHCERRDALMLQILKGLTKKKKNRRLTKN